MDLTDLYTNTNLSVNTFLQEMVSMGIPHILKCLFYGKKSSITIILQIKLIGQYVTNATKNTNFYKIEQHKQSSKTLHYIAFSHLTPSTNDI